jgi:hypothetical protein
MKACFEVCLSVEGQRVTRPRGWVVEGARLVLMGFARAVARLRFDLTVRDAQFIQQDTKDPLYAAGPCSVAVTHEWSESGTAA